MRASSLLLISFVLAATLLAADDSLDESKAIEKIEVLGGKVTRDETLPSHPVVSISLQSSDRLNDNYLHLLKRFDQLNTLDLS